MLERFVIDLGRREFQDRLYAALETASWSVPRMLTLELYRGDDAPLAAAWQRAGSLEAFLDLIRDLGPGSDRIEALRGVVESF